MDCMYGISGVLFGIDAEISGGNFQFLASVYNAMHVLYHCSLN